MKIITQKNEYFNQGKEYNVLHALVAKYEKKLRVSESFL